MNQRIPDSSGGDAEDRDLELLQRLDRLHVAVVSDSLDHHGVRDNVMAPHIRPLTADARVAGYAATVQLEMVDAIPADSADWYRKEIEAIEAMRPGDVLIGSTCPRSYWGELLATTSIRHEVRGMVADAYTRDSAALRELGFPVFVAGIQAQDSLGRVEVVGAGEEIECGGVRVRQGERVHADPDGVVVIPRALALDVIAWAEGKMTKEDEMRRDLESGTTLSAAFRTHKVL
jgi:4-hydroxy-4-methyl-2-oxoglutarate aldolase